MISDEEQDEWQPLENTPFKSERIVLINCDTRDFYCGWRLEDNREDIPDLRTISKPEYRDRFFMTIEEVEEILYDLRERSGGADKKWRMISFIDGNNTIGGSWQFKYLRFYKSEFGWYCRPRSESKVIRKEWLKLPIDMEYLSAH